MRSRIYLQLKGCKYFNSKNQFPVGEQRREEGCSSGGGDGDGGAPAPALILAGSVEPRSPSPAPLFSCRLLLLGE